MQHASRLSRRLLTAVAASALIVGAATAVAMAASAHGSRAHHGLRAAHRVVRGGGGLSITSEPFGTADGQPVTLYTLSNGHRMTVKITNYGGVVQSIWVPDRRGHVDNVALGFSKLADYVTDFTNPPAGGSGDTYFGAIIGRYANRIANHQFTLDGHTFTLPGNNGTNNINTLHASVNNILRVTLAPGSQ